MRRTAVMRGAVRFAAQLSRHDFAAMSIVGCAGMTFLLVSGLYLPSLSRASIVGCASDHCRGVSSSGLQGELFIWLSNVEHVFFDALPFLAGMFFGVPIIRRELERKTFYFAWTQGVSRQQWTLARLLVILGPAALVAGFLGCGALWWVSRSAVDTLFDHADTVALGPLTCTVAAITVGLAVGVAVRSSRAAMLCTLLVVAPLRFAVSRLVETMIVRPVIVENGSPPVDARVISRGFVNSGGADVSPVSVAGLLRDVPPSEVPRVLREHGIVGQTVFRPPSQLLPLQLVEGALYAVVVVVSVAIALWLVRRLEPMP